MARLEEIGELLRRARAGQQDALTGLIEALDPLVQRWSRGSGTWAEDVAQELRLKLFELVGRFRPPEQPSAEQLLKFLQEYLQRRERGG